MRDPKLCVVALRDDLRAMLHHNRIHERHLTKIFRQRSINRRCLSAIPATVRARRAERSQHRRRRRRLSRLLMLLLRPPSLSQREFLIANRPTRRGKLSQIVRAMTIKAPPHRFPSVCPSHDERLCVSMFIAQSRAAVRAPSLFAPIDLTQSQRILRRLPVRARSRLRRRRRL